MRSPLDRNVLPSDGVLVCAAASLIVAGTFDWYAKVRGLVPAFCNSYASPMTRPDDQAQPTFAFPRDVAGRVSNVLADRSSARDPHSQPKMPTEGQLSALLDAAFLASITREEGIQVRVCLRFTDPEDVGDAPVLRLSDPVALSPEALRKVSPAAGPGVELGVFVYDGALQVWGFIYNPDDSPSRPDALLIRAPQPGVLIGSALKEELFVYAQGEAWIFSPLMPSISMWMARRFGHPEGFKERLQIAVQLLSLAVQSLEQGGGATILVVPEGAVPLGILPPRYRAHETSANVLVAAISERNRGKVVRGLANLAKIDGALVVDATGKLLGAGAMVTSEAGSDFEMVLLNTVDVEKSRELKFSEFSGGARHQAAFRFCQANIGAWALVVSHDGVMSVVTRQYEHDVVTVFRPFYAGMRL